MTVMTHIYLLVDLFYVLVPVEARLEMEHQGEAVKSPVAEVLDRAPVGYPSGFI